MDIHDYASRVPKAELHVHLEGSIKPATVWELARSNHITLPALDFNQPQDFYQFQDFEQFLELYFTVTNCLRKPADFRRIAYEFGSECARQNVRYAEVTFTMLTNMGVSDLSWQ